MADSTIIYAVDNTADVNVVAQNSCSRITVRENFNSANPPTQDLLQKMPAGAANAVAVTKGDTAIYTPRAAAYFLANENVGTIRTSAGSITVQQVESSSI